MYVMSVNIMKDGIKTWSADCHQTFQAKKVCVFVYVCKSCKHTRAHVGVCAYLVITYVLSVCVYKLSAVLSCSLWEIQSNLPRLLN